MLSQDVSIQFDQENKIRVLNPDQFQQMENLENECHSFSDKVKNFGETVQVLVEVLDGQAKKIEFEKLRAIGQRNAAEQEADCRRRKQQDMRALSFFLARGSSFQYFLFFLIQNILIPLTRAARHGTITHNLH